MKYDYGLVVSGTVEADSYKEAVTKAIGKAKEIRKLLGDARVQVDYMIQAKEEGDGTDTI
jgi:hypothetical protein